MKLSIIVALILVIAACSAKTAVDQELEYSGSRCYGPEAGVYQQHGARSVQRKSLKLTLIGTLMNALWTLKELLGKLL